MNMQINLATWLRMVEVTDAINVQILIFEISSYQLLLQGL